MKKFFLTSGVGDGQYALTSFDRALYNSKIANYNLVKISSILPPHATLVDRIDLSEGSILHTAYARITTKSKGEHVAAAVAVGIPEDSKNIGVIMEFSDYCNKAQAEEIVKNMVLESMRLRGYAVSNILCASSEATGDGNQYITAFAALAIWG